MIQNRPQFRHNNLAFIEATKCCSYSFTTTLFLNPESLTSKKGKNTGGRSRWENSEQVNSGGCGDSPNDGEEILKLKGKKSTRKEIPKQLLSITLFSVCDYVLNGDSRR